MMPTEKTPYIGFSCAYTPLALIDAAGYAPYRILPMGNAPDMAGQILHDNLCPHVKRVLDRALDNDLPELAGVVILNSCDAMRRLADAWPKVRPKDRVILIDLPLTTDDAAVSYFASELARLTDTLFRWSGRPATQETVAASIDRYNRAAHLFGELRNRLCTGGLSGGAARLQGLYNRAVTQPLDETLRLLQDVARETNKPLAGHNGVPIFLFGNVLPDPEAFGLFESCGVRIVDEDLCTGSRGFTPLKIEGSEETLSQLAREILRRPRCARTLLPMHPGMLAGEVLARAAESKARGVIACTAKFCDPYIARLPGVRETLRKAGLPLLHIEGDCTMRSFGQQRTRIEAFTEMLRR
jgi:benzoyl-CoA reductase/2-hydroxyglutaryl-CoA dehydratase subunit BcrC/BadD/HgdB